MKRQYTPRAWSALVIGLLLAAGVASAASEPLVTTYGSEGRNRAAVLLVGDTLTADVATRLQARWTDEASFFRPVKPVRDAAAAKAALDGWLAARTWHVVVLGLAPGAMEPAAFAQTLRAIVQRLKERNIAVVWCSLPRQGNGPPIVAANDAAREIMRAEAVPMADVHGETRAHADDWRGADAGWTRDGAERCAATIGEPFRRALFSRSTPWAELPVGESHDLSRLLADPAALASPADLPEAKGEHAMVYRAGRGEWQFNLHSFLAHHDGKFWAIWSSGRVNEDSSSQLIRYATSVDGVSWSDAGILAPDPDGESGPWRWMASGIYVEEGRLFALGSLNQGSGPNGGPWSNARLVRFVWVDGGWRQDRVIADDCVVYFPPLRVEGRDFFVWRDSRAHFSTGYAPTGTNAWVVTRVPGPLPEYRMSETSAYVGPDGVVHLIIRDQGYTRRLYHAVSYDAGGTWTIPVKTNYPDAVSKNMAGRLSNGWYYLINNPKASGANARDPLAISFSHDGWTFSAPLALRKNAPALRFPGKAKGSHSYQYSHAIEHGGKLWVIYATNKEDIEVSAFPLGAFAPSFGEPRRSG